MEIFQCECKNKIKNILGFINDLNNIILEYYGECSLCEFPMIRKYSNIFILGGRKTGKTVLCKHILSKLSDEKKTFIFENSKEYLEYNGLDENKIVDEPWDGWDLINSQDKLTNIFVEQYSLEINSRVDYLFLLRAVSPGYIQTIYDIHKLDRIFVNATHFHDIMSQLTNNECLVIDNLKCKYYFYVAIFVRS